MPVFYAGERAFGTAQWWGGVHLDSNDRLKFTSVGSRFVRNLWIDCRCIQDKCLQEMHTHTRMNTDGWLVRYIAFPPYYGSTHHCLKKNGFQVVIALNRLKIGGQYLMLGQWMTAAIKIGSWVWLFHVTGGLFSSFSETLQPTCGCFLTNMDDWLWKSGLRERDGHIYFYLNG